MNKRTAAIFVACAFYTAAFAMNALAVSQPAEHALPQNTLMLMKQELQTMEQSDDLTGMKMKTGALIDALLQALQDGDPDALLPMIADFLAEVNTIEEQQLVEECKDALLTGLFYSGWSLLQTVSGGSDPVCLTLSAGDIIADILIVLQSYQLCVIDNSEVPDEALRETICQQQKLVKTYDFIAGWMYATQCSYGASFITYLTLIVNFLTVSSVCA
jgi:hypothetical protein